MANVKSAMKDIYSCGDFVYDGSLAVAYILTPNGQLTRNPSTGTYTSQYNIPDPMAEKYYWINPYVAYMSNPVMFIDFDGREIRVAKNYQEQFKMDLQSVFGDKVSAARILKLS